MHQNIRKLIRAYLQLTLMVILVFLFLNLSYAQDFHINHGLNGTWYNPETSGQGLLLEINMENNFIFLAWYTYNSEFNEGDSSNHQWYTASGNYINNRAELTIYESSGGEFDNSTAVTTAAVGTATLEFFSCTNADFSYNLENPELTGVIGLRRLSTDILCQTFNQLSETKPQIKKDTNNLNIGINGSWYEEKTVGQGVLFDLIPNANTLFGGWFTYDKNSINGRRWYTLQGNYNGTSAEFGIYETTGGLFNQSSEVNTNQIGTAQFILTSCTNAILGYSFDDGVTGEIALQRLIPTNLCDILSIEKIDLPEEINKSSIVAFYDVNVITMIDNNILTHQTVITQDSKIIQIGHFTQLELPENSQVIDARNKYLSPGLTEMHMHLGLYGGLTFSQDSGLLFIANGVTTVLNMGDSFSIDIPQLGSRFVNEELIGPSLLTANTAYGPPDDGSIRTILTPSEATSYASLLKNSGYDFIKEYWFLEPPVLQQFQIESERLNLPIIGHLPRTRSMATSLANGQKMAAHVQEPFVTYMNSHKNPNLIAPAAQLFVENHNYLTLTMAVFESYVRVYGNNLEQFNQLSTREGSQYMPQVIKNTWIAFFNDPINQGQPGGLNSLYDFFQQIALGFHQAGVPLLIGTDAPGFPGVMPGFGTHEEMKLLHDIGLSNYEVLKAANKNAGAFIDETLDPDISFGTIEIGKKADLLLTKNNPLEDLKNLKNPFAVMARGHLWSKTLLQSKLDTIAKRNSKEQNKSTNDEIISLESWMCLEHLRELNNRNGVIK